MIKSERISWEVLDFWRASGMPICLIRPGSLFVARNKEGAIQGIVALGAERPLDAFVVEPLISETGLIGQRLLDALEKHLVTVGAPGYLFCIDETATPAHRKGVDRMVEKGIFHLLGVDEESQASWYARRFQDFC